MSACPEMRLPRGKARRGGFTLIEVLVVIGILGVVTTLGTSAFSTIMTTWNEKKTITDLEAEAQTAFELIRTDLADALASDFSDQKIHAARGSFEDDRTIPPATRPDDAIAFAIQGTSSGDMLQISARVGYRIQRSGTNPVLVRSIGPLDEAFPEGASIEVIPRVRTAAFGIEYLAQSGDETWSRTWNGLGLPAAIRVSLTLEDAYRTEHQLSRKTVIPIRVRSNR